MDNSKINVNIYYDIKPNNNPDIFSLLGVNALGDEFYTVFQTNVHNQVKSYPQECTSSIDIVAVDDSAVIVLDIPAGKMIYNGGGTPLTGHVELGPFSRGESLKLSPARQDVLNPPYQSYEASERFGRHPKDRLTGVHIKTKNKKKIAVTESDDSMRYPSSTYSCYNLGGDQLIPIGIY